MKKIDADFELAKIKYNNKNSKKSVSKVFIPVLLCLFVLVGIGTSFSGLFSNEVYNIDIEIINGYESFYSTTTSLGEFRDFVLSPNKRFKSIECSSGDMKYDVDTYEIYDDNVTEDTSCLITFENNYPNGLSISDTELVYDNTGVSYLYNIKSSNYIKYSGLLFRIVRINGDGSLRLLLDDSIGEYNYNDALVAINKWFDSIDKSKVVLADFDYDVIQSFDENFNDIYGYDLKNVGLLSVSEIKRYGYDSASMLLSNKYSTGSWGLINYNIQVMSDNENALVRPVINVRANLLTGNGTEELPYEILK